jgi:hypothetical protein
MLKTHILQQTILKQALRTKYLFGFLVFCIKSKKKEVRMAQTPLTNHKSIYH